MTGEVARVILGGALTGLLIGLIAGVALARFEWRRRRTQ